MLCVLVTLLGADSLTSPNMPPVQKESQQQPGDMTSCGFHVIAWTESEYRRLRGEGQYRLSEKWQTKALSLSAFNKNCLVDRKKPGVPAPAADSQPPMPPPKNPPKTPLPVAGRPKALSATFGCPKCRFAQSGCLMCCPEKALKYAERQKRKAAESASETEGPPAGSASEAEGPPAEAASSSTSLSLLDSLPAAPGKRRRPEE